MTESQKPREPMFNFSEKFPPYLAGIFIAIEALLMFLPRSLHSSFELFGVLRPLNAPGTDVMSQMISLVGHGFLHGGWGHVLMNAGMTIVFGIITIRGIKLLAAQKGEASKANLKFMMIFLAGVIIGGIFQWGWWASTNTTMAAAVGASGGASALFASTGWAMGGRNKMIQFGFGWAIINLVMVLAEPILGVSLAWPAHIGGYIGGMILAPFFVRPNSTGFRIN